MFGRDIAWYQAGGVLAEVDRRAAVLVVEQADEFESCAASFEVLAASR